MLSRQPSLNPVATILRAKPTRATNMPRGMRRGKLTKPIEDIQVGDQVWAWDEQTGESVRRPVVRLFRHQGKPTTAVTVVGDDGVVQRIECTTEHPFWVEGKGWVAACELEAGGQLKRIDDGVCLRVASTELTGVEADVFNVEVSEVHNYFVGRAGVLVHNESGAAPPSIPGTDGERHGVGAFVSIKLEQSAKSRTPAQITGFTEANGVMRPTVMIVRASSTAATGHEFIPLTLNLDQAASIRGSATSAKYFSPVSAPASAATAPAYNGGAIPKATLRYWAGLPTAARSSLMYDALQISTSDPLFPMCHLSKQQYLAVMGPAVSVNDAMNGVLGIYLRHPDLATNPLGLLLHGTTSASLLSITQDTGGLLPSGELIRLGKPPMSGELQSGISVDGISHTGVSTVFITKPGGLAKYLPNEPGQGWSPAIGVKNIETLSNESEGHSPSAYSWEAKRLKVERQRLQYWDQLKPSERALVTDNFPVLWRIRPAQTRQILGQLLTSVPHEVVLIGGVSWPEVSEIRVPQSRVDSVASLLSDHGLQFPVQPIDSLIVPRR